MQKSHAETGVARDDTTDRVLSGESTVMDSLGSQGGMSMPVRFKRHRFPLQVTVHAVWL
jgi:hypothetical protein